MNSAPETTTLDKDIAVVYLPAASFPEGVQAAHQQLHALVPFSTERRYFGLSRPNSAGVIEYKAAAEVLTHGATHGLETMVIRSGRYLSVTLLDYLKDVSSICRTFQQLIHQPGIDPEGYCVEWSVDAQSMHRVDCMVRLADDD